LKYSRGSVFEPGKLIGAAVVLAADRFS